MSQAPNTSSQAAVRGTLLSRLDSLYALSLERENFNLCVRIIDMMARLNGLYEKKKKAPGFEEMTLDDFTEDHLSRLMAEAALLEQAYEKKSYVPPRNILRRHKRSKGLKGKIPPSPGKNYFISPVCISKQDVS